ncbi:MAG TPA: signal peptidase I [Acidimicrobiales bacterium]|nr:signal peptidase I [Acidimicrobiales bacterium]
MAVTSTGKGRSRARRLALDAAVLVVAIVVITTLLRTLVFQAFYIPSPSMAPQLEVQDRIVVSKLSYRLHGVRRGDVIVFDNPDEVGPDEDPGALPSRALRTVLEGVNVVKPTTTEYVKRVIGLPGERVAGRGGNLFVDDRRLVEPYLPAGLATDDFAEVTVPMGELFVLGDNRGSSFDSRRFGPIDRSSVVGRAVVKVWPLGGASWL